MFNNFGMLSNINPQRVSGAPTPTGYTPVASANLTAFFLSSITDLITQSANKVSQQDAYLGSGVATQPTAGDQPITNITTLNSRNVIDFAGGGDRLLSNVDFNTASPTNNATLCILAKRNEGLSEITSLAGQWSQSGGDFRRWKIEIDASGTLRLYSNTEFGIFGVAGAGLPVTNWMIYWVFFTASGGSNCNFRYNNNITIGSVIKSNKTNANIGTIFGGAAPSESTTWKGNIASVAFWNKRLSDAEVTTEKNNINSYHGLSF
jgi:hypothetical protein